MLTNNKLYMNLNKRIPIRVKKIFKKIFIFIDKFYYKILFNFKTDKKFI